MTPEQQFFCVIANDPLKESDAIIILEGDGLMRITEGARLYKEGWAPLVVISGGISNPPHSIPAKEMLPHLIEAGVPKDAIILEEQSMHTRDQGVEIMKLAKEKNWQSIIIVASHYHQYRAYLTFLKALEESGLIICIINAPARDLPWFQNDEQGRRIDLLDTEMKRIELYRSNGHIASYEDSLKYQEWKESLK
jgi:uncharacterized SAM-binding protein YcdF (DUF218 family)